MPSENFIQQETSPAPSLHPEENTAPRPGLLLWLAWAVSFLMHPLLLPSLLLGLILVFAPQLIAAVNPEARWLLMLQFAVATFVLPGLSVLSLLLWGSISSLAMTNRHDRRLPFLFVSAIYLIITYFFYRAYPQIPFITVFLFSITACLLSLTIISLYWKISAHGIGAGGVCGFIAAFLFHNRNPELIYPLALLLLLSGIVMWARLYLNHHSPEEVWAGWFIGFLICLGMVFLVYPIL